jgi:hypothetical protein
MLRSECGRRHVFSSSAEVRAVFLAVSKLHPDVRFMRGQFTANTMGIVSEAIGLASIGFSMIPRVYSRFALLRRTVGCSCKRFKRAWKAEDRCGGSDPQPTYMVGQRGICVLQCYPCNQWT